jgi:GNAT superfamily N-acetyltransferase
MRDWTITNLGLVPQFVDTVAERGWAAWWTNSGVSRSDYRAGLEPMLIGKAIPMALVAHHEETYFGSTLLIENDLRSHPHLSPWIAALWVDEEYRGRGIATDLMAAACAAAVQIGIVKVYLCAETKVTPYYLARGWTQIETGFDGLNVFESLTPRRPASETKP